MKEKWRQLMEKDGARTAAASVISILIGLLVGCVIVVISGLASSNMDGKSVWDGVRLVLGGTQHRAGCLRQPHLRLQPRQCG